jgi:hypothetical protein
MNTIEKREWMNDRMSKGYSFRYVKGLVDGHDGPINIGVECVETDEFFPFRYTIITNN